MAPLRPFRRRASDPSAAFVSVSTGPPALPAGLAFASLEGVLIARCVSARGIIDDVGLAAYVAF